MSTDWNTKKLEKDLKNYRHFALEVAYGASIGDLFSKLGKDIVLVVHAAAQPSHGWAARGPFTDFTVNANGTLVMLEMTRQHCPDATFIFTSTNKVYGDLPNTLPLVEQNTRWEVAETHPYYEHGIDETMSLDQSKHSLFGASKVAADVLAQEYGRYFGLKTGTFRGGCLTGPAHSAAELHGFLAYLVKCAISGKPYTIYGYKESRSGQHSFVRSGECFLALLSKSQSRAVYNMGGSRHSNCSMLEAIDTTEKLCGRELNYSLSDQARSGDHIWWISDVRKFQQDYPGWSYRYDLQRILEEIVAATSERLEAATA